MCHNNDVEVVASVGQSSSELGPEAAGAWRASVEAFLSYSHAADAQLNGRQPGTRHKSGEVWIRPIPRVVVGRQPGTRHGHLLKT